MDTDAIVARARRSGRVYIALYFPALILSFLHFDLIFDFLAALAALTVNFYFLGLIGGIRAIAEENDNGRLARMTKALAATALWLAFFEVLGAFYGREGSATYGLSLAGIALGSFAEGIINVRIGIHLLPLQGYYATAAEAAGEWKRAGGWLLITIVLIPIGSILSAVGDYFFLKMLNYRIEHRDELLGAFASKQRKEAIKPKLAKFIADMNPMGVVVERGDEYNDEVALFLRRAGDAMSPDELAEVLRKVFQEMFRTKNDDALVADYRKIVEEYLALERDLKE